MERDRPAADTVPCRRRGWGYLMDRCRFTAQGQRPVFGLAAEAGAVAVGVQPILTFGAGAEGHGLH